MAKTRSNKRPTTTNAMVVDNKASLGNITTKIPTTTSPTNALNTIVNTRTRSKKSKEGLSEEKPDNVISNKKNSKINSSAIENTHNTRRRSSNNKVIKNAAGEMDAAHMDSSPETVTDSNEIHSPESMSENEHEVIKVIEIVDESQSYNLQEDEDEEEGKEYELMYVEDAEEGDCEIEYLNEEYLLDEDFIIHEQQNENNSQNVMVIEEVIDDFSLVSAHDEVVEAEIDPTVEIINKTAKLPPIVPMATRSRRSHITVLDGKPEKLKSTKRNARVSEKPADEDNHHRDNISATVDEIKKEIETINVVPLPISILPKNDQIPKPKVFIPNIEPPATRARSRKSISNSDPFISINCEMIKNTLENNTVVKSDVTTKVEKRIITDSRIEANSVAISTTSNQSLTESLHVNLVQDNSLSELKAENLEVITKTRGRKRTKLLNSANSSDIYKSVLIGNKQTTKIPSDSDELVLSEPPVSKNDPLNDINQESVTHKQEVLPTLKSCELDTTPKLNNIILKAVTNDKPENLTPLTSASQSESIRSNHHIKGKTDMKSSFETDKNEITVEDSKPNNENKMKIQTFSSDKSKETEQPLEDKLNPKCSSERENSNTSLIQGELKDEKDTEPIAEIPNINKKMSNNGSDLKADINSVKVIAEDNKLKYPISQPIQNIGSIDIERLSIVDTEVKEKDPNSNLRILRRRSRKESSPPHDSQIELNESDSLQQITITKSVPEIMENTDNNTTISSKVVCDLSVLNTDNDVIPKSNPNPVEKLEKNEEIKISQEEKNCIKPTSSRSQLAYTSIISTRRQKKEQIKSGSLKPLETISDNCMAIVEKLLSESSLNKLNTKNTTSSTVEASLPTMGSSKLESVKNIIDKTDSSKITMEIETPMKQELESEPMEIDQINLAKEEKKSTDINFNEPLGHSIEEKLKNIKLDQIKIQPSSVSPTKIINCLEPNSNKIKEFETKINRNFYAEAFAGLSHETRTHIFEALLRSKGDTKVPNKDPVKDEPVEFDDKKMIMLKKKSNKKIKKSSKKERKLDKNEILADDSKIDDDESLRRSSRIKTISQTRQRSHGHGLVKARDSFRDMDDEMDEESSNRFKFKALEIDVEAKNYLPTEETEEEIRRELEMVHRLKQFTTIKENIYHCDKNISKEAKKMTCDCFLTKEEVGRGELGCGEDCLNRLLMIECGPKCVVAERCTNRKFQKTQYANCKVFQTEKKGFGIMAGAIIPPGEFIMEYVGEVLNSEQFEKRADNYSKEKNKHYYFMALRSDAVIDATTKGNVSRFINHSCDPNAETQKWTVNGELRIGFFSTRFILKGEEITFDYQFQRYGKEAQKCYCEASNCRGWIGEEPDSADEDDDEEEEEEEEEKNEELLKLPQTEKTELITIPNVSITEVKESNNEDIPSQVIESISAIPKEITEVHIPAVPEIKEIPPLIPIEKIKKQTKKERKALVKTRKTRSELLEDADLEEEISILNRTGLKNQAHTLKLSRLMVRAKLMNARIRLLQLLQNGELPCRRLFLDYHGLRLLHGWMSDSTAVSESLDNVKFQLKLLDTLKALPIPNKTMLKDSKVINLVQKWGLDNKKNYSPNDDTPSDSGSATPIQQTDSPNDVTIQSIPMGPQSTVASTVDDELCCVSKNIIKMSLKLIENWESLPEVFRIPKKERIEQMKEHEREADLRYKALGLSEEKKERYDRYHDTKQEREKQRNWDNKLSYNNNGNNNLSNKSSNSTAPQLDKYQRRQMFEMKFAKEQEEKKKQEYWRLHEMTCTCFRLDPRKTVPEDVPAIVNPATGQWYTKEMKPAATPPSHVHIKPPEQVLSTNPDDYILPKIDLPTHWKFAIDTRGRIYYYHIKIRIPQWEPPIFLPPLAVAEEVKHPDESKETEIDADKESSSTDTTDSSEDELKDRINNLKQRFKERGQPLPIINITDSELVESLDADAKNKDNFSDTFPRIDPVKSSYKINKRKKRREGLVQEKIISPRTEEDKIYGQQQSRLYRETKEKLRRRKEEMRKRRLLESGSVSMRNNKIIKLTDGLPVSISPYDSDESDDESEQSFRKNDSLNQNDPDSAVDFVESLISHNMSDNDARLLDGLKEIGKEKVNKKNVYEEWKKQQAKLKHDGRKRELSQNKLIHMQSTSASTSSSSSSHIKRRKVAMDNIDLSTVEIRRIKEKFRTDIAGVIVQHLGPYRKESCKIGRILHDEDFKHLARKLTHFVMLKELKHCDNTVNILEVTDSVKTKSREFIKKYMAKYGAVYRRGENEPEYKD